MHIDTSHKDCQFDPIPVSGKYEFYGGVSPKFISTANRDSNTQSLCFVDAFFNSCLPFFTFGGRSIFMED